MKKIVHLTVCLAVCVSLILAAVVRAEPPAPPVTPTLEPSLATEQAQAEGPEVLEEREVTGTDVAKPEAPVKELPVTGTGVAKPEAPVKELPVTGTGVAKPEAPVKELPVTGTDVAKPEAPVKELPVTGTDVAESREWNEQTTFLGLPNLTPYTPSGWDYPIVPSSGQGTHSVNTLYAGQPTYIDWAVINNGSATASGRFYSYLYLDGNRIGSWYTDNLPAGYYAYVSDWSYTVSTPGWHTLKIVADATGAIAESNENDNTWERNFYWQGTAQPNLTPYTPSGWDYPIVPSSVRGTTRVNTLYTGQPTYIDWAVINNGSATASGRFYSYLYLDGNRIGSWYTDNLAAGYYAYVSDWSCTVNTPGWHTLKIVADATGAIAESNENDNTWERNFYWEGAAKSVTELPFIGSYNVSCGYHTNCGTTPPTPGYGLDFVNNNENEPTYGDVTYASGRGTVTASGWESGGWGNRVIIRHPDNYYSRYAHLEYYFPAVNHKMREGSPIGYMGMTGGSSTGDHLHFQVYYNTTSGGGVDPTPIDGYTWFPGAGGTPSPYENYSFNTEMRLVDNTDGGFSLTGTASCSNNTTNGFHRNGLSKSVTYYQYCNGTTGSPTRTGTWTPSLPASGNYHVYVFAPNHSVTLTGNARYRVYSNNTLIATISVNQNGYNNDWVRLGMWNLSTSGTYVRLTNQTSDGRRVAYDAVMLVRDF
jgi:hypothetical protein